MASKLSISLLLLLALGSTGRAAPRKPAPSSHVQVVLTRATTFMDAKQFSQAQKLLEAELAKPQSSADKIALQNALADVHYCWGEQQEEVYDWPGAVLHYRLSYETDQKLRPGEAADDLNNIGTAYYSLSRYQEALDYYQKALYIKRRIGDREGESLALNNIGNVYSCLSRYQESIDCYQKSLFIKQKTGDKIGEANNLNNIGTVYYSLSRYHEALGYYQKALPIKKNIGDKRGESDILYNVGTVYHSLSRYQEALRYYRKALLIKQTIGDRTGESLALNSIGLAYSSLSRYQEALRYYQKTLLIRQTIGDRTGEADTLNNIGVVYYFLSRYQESLNYYQKALFIKQKAGDRTGEAAILSNLMDVYKAQKQPEVAILFGKQSVNVKQAIRRDMSGLDKQSRDAYLNSNKSTYEQLAALLIERGRLPEAEAVNRMLRQSETLGFVRAGAPSQAAAPLPLYRAEQRYLEQYQPLAGKAALVGEELAMLRAIAPSKRTEAQKARLATLQQQEEGFKAKFRLLRSELAQALKDANATDKLDIVSSEEWKKTLRDLEAQGAGKTALLSTVIAPDKFYVILTTGNSSEEFSINVPKAEVDKLTAAASAALQNPRVDPRPALQALYHVVFCDGRLEQALSEAGIQTALWLVSGNLRSIPLDALFDGQHYLVEKARLNIGITLNSRAYLEAPKEGEVLAVGTSQAHEVELKSGDVSLGHFHFDPLSGVPDELRGIAKDVAHGGQGPVEGTILLDNNPAFTAAELVSKAGDGYSILHMATHFNVGLDDTTSFFLLGDGQPLTVVDWETKVPMTNLELLTLSACDTGDAKMEQSQLGAKIGSMGEIAQRNGVHSVIVTLWSVNDAATSRLMRDFYSRWQAAPQEGKGEALRVAQRALLGVREQALPQTPSATDTASALDERGQPKLLTRNPNGTVPFVVDPAHPYAHPYYWAPFTLIGNWR